MRITSPTPHPHLWRGYLRSSRIKVLSLPPSWSDKFQWCHEWFISTGYNFLFSSHCQGQQYHHCFQQWHRIHKRNTFQSLPSSRHDDFQWCRGWFIGTGYNFLPSSRHSGQQYCRRCQPQRRIHGRDAHDGDSLSTTEMFDGVNFTPIIEDLRQIAINWQIHFGDDSCTVYSCCFGFTEKVRSARFFRDPAPIPTKSDSKRKLKKLHWVYKSALLLFVSFPWQFGMYELSEDAPFLHISLFRYDNISFYLFFHHHSNAYHFVFLFVTFQIKVATMIWFWKDNKVSLYFKVVLE